MFKGGVLLVQVPGRARHELRRPSFIPVHHHGPRNGAEHAVHGQHHSDAACDLAQHCGARLQILQQSALAMIAQAGRIQQNVLTLLQN